VSRRKHRRPPRCPGTEILSVLKDRRELQRPGRKGPPSGSPRSGDPEHGPLRPRGQTGVAGHQSRAGAVAHACNPSYPGGRHREDHGSRPDPISKITRAKWTEVRRKSKFKPQSCQKGRPACRNISSGHFLSGLHGHGCWSPPVTRSLLFSFRSDFLNLWIYDFH
jgi:hypothetical protein